MPKVAITKSKLDALAAKIAAKSGETLPLTLDEMGDAVDGISGGGVFEINLTLNTTTKMWEPDKTFAQIQDAHNAGKTLVTYAGAQYEPFQTSCIWYDGDAYLDPVFWYVVSWFDYYEVVNGLHNDDYYQLDITGLVLDSRQESQPPLNLVEKTITVNGTYNPILTDYADGYSLVTVNVPSSQPTLETVEHVQPSESSQTITPGTGYDALSSVQIDPVDSEYIGSDVPRRSSSDLSASGATVTVPAGYYGSQASKTVANGTAGTPSATKGSVSNHQVSVTPSVTNQGGYIEGGTKTGTPVTVSAAELVSGSETKTANGTYDVTNLAQLVVNVAASGGKAGQIQSRVGRTNQTAYTDMGFEITVAKAGTYDIYWTGYRSSTGGTNGAQVYKNGAAIGNAQTTFDGTYTNVQNGHVFNQSLAAGDKITIRARARGTNYYMYIMNLAIIEA